MAAVAKRESNPDAFVGQVLARSSPILTWRPAVVAKAAREAAGESSANDVLEDRESSVHRISRAPTRRMVAWPVIKQVHRVHKQSPWTIVRRAAIAVVAVSVLVAAGVAAYAHESLGVALVSPPVAKVIAAHVIDPGFDALVSPSKTPVAPAPIAMPAPNATPAPIATPPARLAPAAPLATQRGRAHHGHRHATSAAR